MNGAHAGEMGGDVSLRLRQIGIGGSAGAVGAHEFKQPIAFADQIPAILNACRGVGEGLVHAKKKLER